MDMHVKTLWVNALESGEFKQETGNLRAVVEGYATGHCCLGVLCEVFKRETGKGEWRGSRFVASPDQDSDEGEGVLPDAVKLWAGLPHRNPNVVIERRNQSVAEHNDGTVHNPSRTFKEIAAAISSQL